MTDTNASRPADGVEETPPAQPETFAGLDIYTMRARWAPALLTCLPLLLLAALALPYLDNANKWWSLLSVGVTTLAALLARKAGNRAQPGLYVVWGGVPTTVRLRYSSDASQAEVARRHRQVERILGDGLRLPTPEEEEADPQAADRVYDDAMRRIVSLVRHSPVAALAITENRNYGFARNLYGLKRAGVASAVLTLAVCAIGATVVTVDQGISHAGGLLVPALVAMAALALWPHVDEDFVKNSADAYADRVIEALDRLPSAAPPE